MTTSIIKSLQQWTITEHAPFYTPGHKHGWGMGAEFTELLQTAGLKLDLPEIPVVGRSGKAHLCFQKCDRALQNLDEKYD